MKIINKLHIHDLADPDTFFYQVTLKMNDFTTIQASFFKVSIVIDPDRVVVADVPGVLVPASVDGRRTSSQSGSRHRNHARRQGRGNQDGASNL